MRSPSCAPAAASNGQTLIFESIPAGWYRLSRPMRGESTSLPYISDLAPERGLFPAPGTFARAQGQAWLSFLSSTLHAALTPAIVAEGADNDELRRANLDRVAAAFEFVNAHLAGRDHLLDSFSICDLYLFALALWRSAPTISGELPEFSNIDRLQQSLLGRRKRRAS